MYYLLSYHVWKEAFPFVVVLFGVIQDITVLLCRSYSVSGMWLVWLPNSLFWFASFREIIREQSFRAIVF